MYVLPSGVLLGEATAWVSDRLGRTQHSLREQEASFRKLFLENPQPMWVFDLEDLRFLEVNAAAIEHYGYSREEFLAMRVTDIRPADDVRAFLDEVAVAPALHHSPVAWRHVLKDGRTDRGRHHRASARVQGPRRDAHRDPGRDRAQRSRTRAAPPGVPRRAHRSREPIAVRESHGARARTRQARNDSSIGVVVLDLDGFKTVNDSLGHSVGDELLFAVGDRLRNAVRPGDTVARLGGDEFAILLEDVPTIEHLGEQAERILRSLAEPFELAGKSLVVTASAGVTLNRPGDGPEELIRNADMAMYLAKRDGKACVRRFEPALHHAALDRLELEADLRRALQRDELVVHYQPTVRAHDRRDQRVRGARALAASAPRAARAVGVHPARRGDRAHHRHRALGARSGVPPGARVAADARDRST